LKRICEDSIIPGDIQATAALMLNWIEDVKQLDGIAEWSWKLLGRGWHSGLEYEGSKAAAT